jgi:hypothetical protein
MRVAATGIVRRFGRMLRRLGAGSRLRDIAKIALEVPLTPLPLSESLVFIRTDQSHRLRNGGLALPHRRH